MNSVHVVWSKKSPQCYQSKTLPSSVRVFTQAGFCVKRVISVSLFRKNGSSYELFTESDLHDSVFGPFSPDNVTLIFNSWHTPWYVANSQLQNPNQCREIKVTSRKAQFRPSPRLLADVKYYKDHFLNSSNTLAIMVRLERMLLKFRRSKDVENQIQRCLMKVTNIVHEIWKRKKPSVPLVTLDLGKYGSGSWDASMEEYFGNRIDSNRITSFAKETLLTLFNNHWSFEQWEQSFTQAAKGLENSGYIAALQRTLASQAECLVLAGGGNFQELAVRDYMREHPDKGSWCIYLVCPVDGDRLTSEIRQSMTTLRFYDS